MGCNGNNDRDRDPFSDMFRESRPKASSSAWTQSAPGFPFPSPPARALTEDDIPRIAMACARATHALLHPPRESVLDVTPDDLLLYLKGK